MKDLGTAALTWHDLYVVVHHLPRTSALVRAIEGDDWQWDLPAQLAAAGVDALRILIWQQTADGSKGRNQPKPIPRPGVDDEDDKTFGKDAVSIDEMNSFLGWEQQLATPDPVSSVTPDETVPPPTEVMRMEHDRSIAGHEHDCTICKPPRKRDARGRFAKN